jgi:hypothetical protein
MATSGTKIRRTSVPICPELTAAIVTGEIAYRNAAGMEIQLLLVNFLSNRKPVHIINIGAIKKKVVMKNGIFPNTAIDARAVTATQGGVAREEPIPT